MRILLDTGVLILALVDRRRILPVFRAALIDPDNEVLFSPLCIWEIALKFGLGRADFRLDPRTALESARRAGFAEHALTSDAALGVADLPLHHRDPFDRLLVAQALQMPARLYTTDRTLARYSELVTLVG